MSDDVAKFNDGLQDARLPLQDKFMIFRASAEIHLSHMFHVSPLGTSSKTLFTLWSPKLLEPRSNLRPYLIIGRNTSINIMANEPTPATYPNAKLQQRLIQPASRHVAIAQMLAKRIHASPMAIGRSPFPPGFGMPGHS